MTPVIEKNMTLELICSHISQKAGFQFGERKKRQMADLIQERCRALHLKHFRDYYNLLISSERAKSEFACLMDRLTIQESFFFRQKAQFDVLKSFCLPLLMKGKKDDHPINIWSAGCARGEEAYSIAMLVREFIPDAPNRVRIKATDISEQALREARKGRYTQRAVRDLESHYLKRWFLKHEKGYELDPEIRAMVDFEYLNLSEISHSQPYMPNWDIIFCRNVIIYFTAEFSQKLMKDFYAALRPGGFLFSGFSETMRYLNEDFIPIQKQDTFFYQKPHPHQVPARKVNTAPTTLPKKKTSTVKAKRKICESEKKPRPKPEKIPRLSPPKKAPALDMAAKLADAGETLEALEMLNAIIGKDPLNEKAYFMMAMIYRNAGNREQSLNYLKKVVYLEPQNPLARLHLGDLFNELSQKNQAAREYANVISLLENRQDLQKETFSDGFAGETILATARAHLNRINRSSL